MLAVKNPPCYDTGVAIPFQAVYPDEIKISASRVNSLINTYHERQRTGLIRLAYSSEKLLYLLFQRGSLLNAYSVSNGGNRRIEDWAEIINATPEAFARLVPLSPFAVEMCKIMIESATGKVNTMSVQELRASLDHGWKQIVDPLLVHLGWNTAEGLVFFKGPKSECHSLFFSPDRLVDEVQLSSDLSMWSEPSVNASLFEANLDVLAWQEYILRRAFAEICNQAITRYEEITGRAIVDSAVRSLGLYASRHSVEINITSRRVVDRELFSTPQDGADRYRALLKIMLDQIGQVIGAKLSSSILSSITAGLRFDEFQVARGFSILPPELFRVDSPRQSAA